MAATPEKKVKDKVVKLLKQYGIYYIGIECKAGKGKTTALQDRELAAIKTAGGYDLVVNENNLDDVDEILKTIDNYHQEGETCS